MFLKKKRAACDTDQLQLSEITLFLVKETELETKKKDKVNTINENIAYNQS